MGRPVEQSNPTEINGNWVPAGDDAAGRLYTQQSYDWQGRPLITTNTDGTMKEASYSGCGCAGGQVVTITDEGTLSGGVAKKRQQKIYSDVLGRTVKTEVLNWDGAGPFGTGGSVYAATVNTYTARDQVTLVRQYAGSEGSGTYQETTMTYDGYGRLKTKHVPEQDAGTVTTWGYNLDDTIQKITDARGSVSNFSYNARHLLTGITYDPSSGITDTPDVSFGYDAAGNRTSMTDGLGGTTYGYDQLSRLTSESRTFTGLAGSFSISYGYNLANQLTSLAEPAQFGSTFSYVYDATGRLTTVNGSSFGGVTTYASNSQYRAWGGLKHLNYGNSKTLDATYSARLQAATFNIPGVMSKTYDYYADGSLRFSSDLLEHKFDRSYSYDHSARMTQAFSGAEARGEPATNDRPYRETFSYDAFSHLTNRNSNNWNDFYSMSDSYLNNRRDGWDYDVEGNLLGSFDATYTYDAAGDIRTVGTYEPQSTTTRGLDADQRQVRSE
jgi:YD repeat-containing protein